MSVTEIRSAFSDITCCKLRAIRHPSGRHLSHADDCPAFPGMKVRDSHPELRRLSPRPASDEPHKACRTANVDGRRPCSRCAPMLHPATCACASCQYASAHSDDAPDWGRA